MGRGRAGKEQTRSRSRNRKPARKTTAGCQCCNHRLKSSSRKARKRRAQTKACWYAAATDESAAASKKTEKEKEKDARERKRGREEELKSSKTTSVTFIVVISLSFAQYAWDRSNRDVSCDSGRICRGGSGGGGSGGGVHTPDITRGNAKGNGCSHLGDDGDGGSGADTSWCPGHSFDGVGGGGGVSGHRCVGTGANRKRSKCHQGHRQRRERWVPAHGRRCVEARLSRRRGGSSNSSSSRHDGRVPSVLSFGIP
ncbi:hypothetical protein EDC96DRAFT_603138 [Choanephora cucurbitarum]|nr:hypothetical protein EDC96DRAFT_603138 [Choanephora cucurbitarum]